MSEQETQTALLKTIAKHMRDLHLWTVDAARREDEAIANEKKQAARDQRVIKYLEKIHYWIIWIGLFTIISTISSCAFLGSIYERIPLRY